MSTSTLAHENPPHSSQDPITGAPSKVAASPRLMSVDALRGFDMFWIIGADALVNALHRMTPNPVTTLLADQLEHVPWAGFHFYDLIFPLFVFIVGVSLVFSLGKTIAQEGRAEALKRIFRRSGLLFVIALLYSGGFSDPWPNIRLLGVLNRIALCYFFASLLFCFCKPRVLAAVCVALLAGYWALMTFVPIRDIYLVDPARTKSWEIQHRPSAGRDDRPVALRQLRNCCRLVLSKGRFAFGVENVTNLAARTRDDDLICVQEFVVQLTGNQPADDGFASPHKANQGHVPDLASCTHSIHVAHKRAGSTQFLGDCSPSAD